MLLRNIVSKTKIFSNANIILGLNNSLNNNIENKALFSKNCFTLANLDKKEEEELHLKAYEDRVKEFEAPVRQALTEEEYYKKYQLLGKEYEIDYYNETHNKHRQKVEILGYGPKIAQNAFAAPCATISGNVELWDYSSIWYGAVVRGDTNLIRIGSNTNIQDKTIITATDPEKPISLTHDGSTIIGHNVVIGHNCRLHACTIEDDAHIGMNCIIQENCTVERGAMLGAGTVLPPDTVVPHGQLWVGNPGRYVRDLNPEEGFWILRMADHYAQLAEKHLKEFAFLCYPMEQVKQAEKRGIKLGWQEPTEKNNKEFFRFDQKKFYHY